MLIYRDPQTRQTLATVYAVKGGGWCADVGGSRVVKPTEAEADRVARDALGLA